MAGAETSVSGPLSVISLQEAREKAHEGRKLAQKGLDPAIEWKRVRRTMPTFEEAAKQYYENVRHGWKNGKHIAQWLSTLEAHAFPAIGSRPVGEVDAAAVQDLLLPIWLKIPETARRVRQRVGAVLDYAHGQGWRNQKRHCGRSGGDFLNSIDACGISRRCRSRRSPIS